MTKQVSYVIASLLMASAIVLSACANATGPESNNASVKTGSLSGSVTLSNSQDHSGIVVFADKVEGSTTASVRSVLAAGAISRAVEGSAVAASTKTGADGSYLFSGLEPGTYTVYAVSNDSMEGAVSRQVVVTADTVTIVESLVLTPVGKISGSVNHLYSDLCEGVTVYVAGTNYIAKTDAQGKFTINSVPAGDQYTLRVAFWDRQQKYNDVPWKAVVVESKKTTEAGIYELHNGITASSEHVTVSSDSNGIKFTIDLPYNEYVIIYETSTYNRYEPRFSDMGKYSFVYPLVSKDVSYTFDIQFTGSDFNGEEFQRNEYVTCTAGGGIGSVFDYSQASWKDLTVEYTELGDKRLVTLKNFPSVPDTRPEFITGTPALITDYYLDLQLAIGKLDWVDTKWFYQKGILIKDNAIRTQFCTEGADLLNLDVYGTNWRDANTINNGLSYKRFFCFMVFFVQIDGYDGWFGTNSIYSPEYIYNPVLVD